jgi:hypothetical protein
MGANGQPSGVFDELWQRNGITILDCCSNPNDCWGPLRHYVRVRIGPTTWGVMDAGSPTQPPTN